MGPRLTVMLIMVFSIMLAGCQKESENTDYSHGRISQSLYPFLFDTGSYWIYKKANSNILDSTVVKSISKDTFIIGPFGPGQGNQGDEEYYNIQYLSFPANNTYDEQLLGYVISRGLYSGGFVLLSSKKIGDKSQNAEILDVMDSLTIEHKTYKTVVKMKVSQDEYIDQNYQLYYVDSIGVIKKEITGNGTVTETWNLLRFRTKLLPVKKTFNEHLSKI
jgi:hypothetical protein